MQSPSTKPSTGQKQNLILILGLLTSVLIFGDYYIMSHEQEIHQARLSQLTSSQNSSQPLKLSPQQSKQIRSGKATSLNYRGSKPATAKEYTGPSLKQRLFIKADNFFYKAGIYIRGVLITTSLLLLFGQKAPVRKPGKPRLKPLGKNSRTIVYLEGS
ncbi:hypothetical protein [Adhaeribacter rhizoryzae]|uniref:Uncharacterized protein n=1 Tax=Adhaeribacter rhizoryzae TaxID=2607907 RepID=A0A5M6CUK1_9BACT|nr:hypothetical protein [Adhaeribacter rhizoryzae]KAA5538743.1 hypothetical protein F0145_25715 [Adhaeribacter rhizoryzae]